MHQGSLAVTGSAPMPLAVRAGAPSQTSTGFAAVCAVTSCFSGDPEVAFRPEPHRRRVEIQLLRPTSSCSTSWGSNDAGCPSKLSSSLAGRVPPAWAENARDWCGRLAEWSSNCCMKAMRGSGHARSLQRLPPVRQMQRERGRRASGRGTSGKFAMTLPLTGKRLKKRSMERRAAWELYSFSVASAESVSAPPAGGSTGWNMCTKPKNPAPFGLY
mmetsp:Transcript_47458/g.113873  ORF Transcript_47458/g.113873 Transcript_47458/m.113873 type:complete len:215 (-) Transcript_47458:468-1112(-)